MKKRIFLIIFMALTGFLGAQTAEEMDRVFAVGELTYTQAARFVLRAADAFPEDGDTLAAAQQARWLPGGAKADSPIPLGEVSLLIMRAFGLKGGVMYTVTHSPRYACRELVYTRIIQGRTDPAGRLDGRAFLQILGRVLILVGENEERAAMAVEDDAARIAAEAEAAEAEARRLENEAALAEAARVEMERLRLFTERQRMAAAFNLQLEAMQVADTTAAASDEGVTISLSNINFQADSTQLEAGERDKIRNIAEILKTVQIRNILVAGHTAMAGTREGQIQISRERARAVAEYLVQLGARRREEITVEGYGAERPVADTTTAAGMALNRRVEIIILEKQ